MKRIVFSGAFLLPFTLCWAAGLARAAPFDPTLSYPSEVALSGDASTGYVFRRFPGSQRLYYYDLDQQNRSNCNVGCDGARQPVLAPASAMPMGDWSVVVRYDGKRQWAYKGRPVYTFFHEPPDQPHGDGEGGVWHLLPYEK